MGNYIMDKQHRFKGKLQKSTGTNTIMQKTKQTNKQTNKETHENERQQ
jgi:hypothetical protein